jgi:hypothetical protein
MSTRADNLATFMYRFSKKFWDPQPAKYLRASPDLHRESFVYFLRVNRERCGRKYSEYIRRDSRLSAPHRISKRRPFEC